MMKETPLTMVLGIVKRLLDALKGENFSADVFPDFLEAFSALFRCNISKDNLRSLALFVTYALQDNRAFPSQGNRQLRTSQRHPNGRPLNVLTSDASTSSPRSSSPAQPPKAANDLSRHEVGVQVLEMFTDLLCNTESLDPIKKFAKTVANKVNIYS
jgi:hypothetical protein